MEIPLKLEKDKRYLEILRLFSNMKHPNEITPYNKLRNRELELLAIIYYFYNDKYGSIPEEERNTLIFSSVGRTEMQRILSTEEVPVTKETVYNIMLSLRKKGLIEENRVIKKNVIPVVDKLTLKFIK